jgi:hypothetical protein
VTDDEKISGLQQMLSEPEGKYTHDQVRQRLMSLTVDHPSRDIPVGVAAPRQAPPPEIAARQRSRLGDAVDTFTSGARALYDAARHPVDTFTNPAKLSNLARGVDDMTTFGAGQKLADWAGSKLHYNPPWAPTHDELEAPENARFRNGGNLLGLATPGGTERVAAAGGKLAEKALGGIVAKSAIPGMAMGAAKGVFGYEAAAPVIAGAQAGVAGQNPIPAMKDAATDPMGLMLSGTLGGVGGAGRGKAARIRDPKTLSGRTIADVNAVGGKIRPFGEPVEGGLYETPEMQGLPEGRAGTNKLADQSQERLQNANKTRLKAARQQYGDTIDNIIKTSGPGARPVPESHAALDQMEAENSSRGAIIDPQTTLPKSVLMKGDEGTAKAIEKVRAMLSRATSTGIVQAVSPEDFVKTRKLVRKMANNAQDPAEERVYSTILGHMDKDAEQFDPRIKQMNTDYAQALQPVVKSNEMLFGAKNTKDIDVSESQRKRARGFLGRVGDNTQAATTDPHEDLAALGPEYSNEVKMVAAKKAQERLRRGSPEVSTSIEQSLGKERRNKMGLAAVGGAMGGLPGIAAGYVVGKVSEDPLANRIRLGLPAAETAGRATGSSGVAADALIQALRTRRANAAKNWQTDEDRSR